MLSGLFSQTRVRWFVVALTWLAVIVLLVSGCGAKKARVYRIGILSGLDLFATVTDGFKAGMADLGYVEGQNVVYDVQSTNFDMAAYRRIVEKFVADKVDIIVAFPTEAALEAKAAAEGTNIPVVFVQSFVEDIDLIDSVREPGGNITGVRLPGPDMALRRFEVLLEMAPEARRIWVPYQNGYVAVPCQLEVLRLAAEAAGVTLVETPLDDLAALQADLQSRAQAADPGVDAILMIAETLISAPDGFTAAAQFAYERQMPIGGALMTVGDYSSLYGVIVNNEQAGKQAAALADKILKGMPAGKIPVVSGENYLQINYPATQDLGVTVPDGLLKQADEIIR